MEPYTGSIYTITCSKTGMAYVGSSKSVASRFARHRSMLRAGDHHAPLLQEQWRQHGEAAFVFEVVEEGIDALFLLAREQYWIWRLGDSLLNALKTSWPTDEDIREARRQADKPRRKAEPMQKREPAPGICIRPPNPATHDPRPEKVQELLERIGESALWVSKHSGIPYNRLRMLLVGYKEVGGKRIAVVLRYPEQYALEMILAFREAAARLE